jgi:hypothetical protein
VNINEVWHQSHIAGVSFYILTFILGFTFSHTPKIERKVSVKYENKILSRLRPVFSTSSPVRHPSSRYEIMHQRKLRTMSCKNTRRWTIMKFVSQILQDAVTFFFSETLYYTYSCIRSVFLTHIFNWLHVCDKIHVVCHLSAINWKYMWEIFSVSIFLINQLILRVCMHVAKATLETSIDRKGYSGCGYDERTNRKSIVTKLLTIMWVKVKVNERDVTK